MTRRNGWRRKDRLLERPLVTLALARGGMIFDLNGVWVLYRSQDARRMRVGVVPAGLATELEAEGIAVRAGGLPARLCAGQA
ncbi:MAG: hypothetical protein IPK75_00550 [Acidobacteria bacterium]|nr:hypothetical protein [Acidobacteriota bacterium]